MYSNLFLPIPGSVVGNFLGTSATFADIGATFPSPVNRDFIIVQVDETHTDQQTVYMYSGATSAWVYIGVWSSAEKAEHRYIDFDLEPNVPSTAGRLFWDAAAQTLALGMPGGSVNLQIGQEQLVRVKNTTGGDLLNGTPVYLTANPAEGFISIGLSDSESQDNCRKTIAVLTEDIDHNRFGYATTFGLVRELNTNAWTEGDELFVKATGGLTNVMPVAPEAVVRVGIVVQKSATEGVIFVDIIPLSMKELLVDSGDLTVKMEAGKTLVLSSPVYEDLNFDPANAGGPASNIPDYVTIDNIIYREFTSANNQKCGSGNEVPHEAKLSSTFFAHLHIFLKSGESAGTTGVTFTIYWALRETDGTYTNGSVPLTASSAQLTANPVKLDLYDVTGFAGPDTLGAQLSLAIARTGGNAGDVVVTTFGIHYPVDTMGSRLISAK